MPTAQHRQIGLLAGVAALGLIAAGGLMLSRGTAEAPESAGLAVADATDPAPPAAVLQQIASDPKVDAITTAAIPPVISPAPPLTQSAFPEWASQRLGEMRVTADGPSLLRADFAAVLDLVESGAARDAFAAASAFDDDIERKAGQWAAIYFGGGDVPLASVEAFMAEAPDFARGAVFRTRFEQALIRTRPDSTAVIERLSGAMPRTFTAQVLLATSYAKDGQTDRAKSLARTIWVGNFLTKDEEARVLSTLGELLTPADHWDRAVHMMMHDRATAAERLSRFLTPAQQSLMAARNATSRKAKDAKALLDKVDASMTTHPLYLFSRAQRAQQAGLLESAIDWLDKQATEPPDAAEWWYLRRSIFTTALSSGDTELAFRAADGYRQGPEGRLVEAHFHAGWTALSFLKDSTAAIMHFTEMVKHSTLPDSVTQANYWLARAQRSAGNVEAATAALRVAAEYPTVYYGLLARSELAGAGAQLRDMPDWEPAAPAFEQRDIVKAIRLFAEMDETDRALPLLRALYPELKEGAEMRLAARLAQELDAHNLAITIAAVAEQRGTPLDIYGFPRDPLPEKFELASIDRAAVYAVTRQESRFQIDAVSSAGARGLMQLMPGTARETAGKLGLEYSRERLTSDAEYNAQLGSAYLKAQLDRFDGSLLLAAAAYNAGPGNALKWIAAYGDPRSDKVDPVLWVELIPFQETRTYVKRVLGNYMVYRARAGDTQLTLHKALRQIPL